MPFVNFSILFQKIVFILKIDWIVSVWLPTRIGADHLQFAQKIDQTPRRLLYGTSRAKRIAALHVWCKLQQVTKGAEWKRSPFAVLLCPLWPSLTLPNLQCKQKCKKKVLDTGNDDGQGCRTPKVYLSNVAECQEMTHKISKASLLENCSKEWASDPITNNNLFSLLPT